MRRVLVSALTAASICAVASTAAQASVTVSGDGFAVGHFSGQDCPITGPGNPGFSTCYATHTGTSATAGSDPAASLVVASFGLTGAATISDNYKTIDGSEFTLSLSDGNVLSFTYNMGPADPVLHWLSVKQADGYELFFDSAGFTSGTTYTFTLNNYFPNNPGISHVTVFDTTGAVPEPTTWALMLLGFGGVGMALRRSRRSRLMQLA